MEGALIRTLADTTKPVEQRVAAARALGARKHATYHVWNALCALLHAPAEPAEVRIAVARAIGDHNPAGARNQLCRYFEGDGDRRVRREAVAILARLGRVAGPQEASLQRDLQALQASMASYPLVNLASSYGRDPRVLAVLDQSARHPDPEIREIAQRGLGMLGETTALVAALRDESPRVRAGAAATLGYYSLLAPEEVAALEAALQDADALVQRSARTALRRLGLRPAPAPGARPRPTRPPAPGRLAWAPLLEEWSREWLSVREYVVEMPDEAIETGWLGFAGASEPELTELERRLGRALPPSYRSFLALTNGWRRTSPFIEQMYSTAEVDYFRVRNQEWIDIWQNEGPDVSAEQHRVYGEEQSASAFRAAYLRECVQISAVGDAAVYLLNPAIVTAEGEWEAWFMASWLPGAERYRSFWDLMRAEHATFVQVEKPVP